MTNPFAREAVRGSGVLVRFNRNVVVKKATYLDNSFGFRSLRNDHKVYWKRFAGDAETSEYLTEKLRSVRAFLKFLSEISVGTPIIITLGSAGSLNV